MRVYFEESGRKVELDFHKIENDIRNCINVIDGIRSYVRIEGDVDSCTIETMLGSASRFIRYGLEQSYTLYENKRKEVSA